MPWVRCAAGPPCANPQRRAGLWADVAGAYRVNGIMSGSLALLLLQVRVQDGDAGHRLHDRHRPVQCHAAGGSLDRTPPLIPAATLFRGDGGVFGRVSRAYLEYRWAEYPQRSLKTRNLPKNGEEHHHVS